MPNFSHESAFDALLTALRQFPVFTHLSPATLSNLNSELVVERIQGGQTLFEQGDAGDCLYVIVFGRLRVSIRGDDGERVVREMGRGELVGEMAILTGEPRSATVRAVRDTELLRLSKEGFERAVANNPSAMLDVARLIVARLRNPDPHSARNRLKAVALLPAGADVPVGELAEKLTAALAAAGHHVRRLDAQAVDEYLSETAAAHEPGYIEREAPRWLHEQETEHDLLVYVADAKPSVWTQLCLRQADTVLIVGHSGCDCEVTPELSQWLARSKGPADCSTQLVLLYDSAKSRPSRTDSWLERLHPQAHYHVDVNAPATVARLARLLTGEAGGIVLGGGGARGFAHIGVLRALAEENVPVDLLGGTSMGAIIAGQYAADASWEELRDNCRRVFIDAGSLDDYTLPIMALLRGRRYKKMLLKLFGDSRIEDFPLPFYCISTNLTRSMGAMHTRGLARQWIGASMAVPGLGPPIFHQREVHVDGGVVNNLPADVMLAMGLGPVMAVSVTPDTELPLDDDYPDTISPWRVLLSRLNPLARTLNVPGIGSILMQTAWISQATAGATVRKNVDLFFEPPVTEFRLRDWHGLDQLIEIGYEHAKEKIAAWRTAAD